jgi:protein-S-isoprenylcysteine O-methyltransferase Ste14
VLHTEGPYAVTRHPIYTGILGMLLGTALASGLGRLLAVFLLGVVWVEVKVQAEERLLTTVFGEEYQRYRRRVPPAHPWSAQAHRAGAPMNHRSLWAGSWKGADGPE